MSRVLKKSTRRPKIEPAASFRTFLKHLQSTDPLISVFLHAVQGVPLTDVKSWAGVRARLNEIGAPPEVYVGARLAWRGYAAEQRVLEQRAAHERRRRQRESRFGQS